VLPKLQRDIEEKLNLVHGKDAVLSVVPLPLAVPSSSSKSSQQQQSQNKSDFTELTNLMKDLVDRIARLEASQLDLVHLVESRLDRTDAKVQQVLEKVMKD